MIVPEPMPSICPNNSYLSSPPQPCETSDFWTKFLENPAEMTTLASVQNTNTGSGGSGSGGSGSGGSGTGGSGSEGSGSGGSGSGGSGSGSFGSGGSGSGGSHHLTQK